MALSDKETLELVTLVNALIDGQATETQRNDLEQHLLTNEDARAWYVRFMAQSASLCHYASEMQTEQALPVAVRQPSTWIQRLFTAQIGWVVAAAALVALFIAPMLSQQQRHSEPTIPNSTAAAEPTSTAIAMILQSAGVVWDDPAQAQQTGVALAPGWLRFKSGMMEIEFYSGARVLLTGPAAIEINSSMSALCTAGVLSVEVPTHAHGFTISTPQLRVTDLGTAFGINVAQDGTTDVHVFTGEVNWTLNNDDGTKQSLVAGQAIHYDGDAVAIMPAVRAQFPDRNSLAERVEIESRSRQMAWLDHMSWLASDPASILQMNFTGPAAYRVVANASQHANRASDGSIVGCTWSQGRWPTKRALEFNSVSDRVRIYVPGEFPALTMLAWVRIDSLQSHYSSLLMCDGFETGECHWQIADDGTIAFGVQGAQNKRGLTYKTGVVITPDRLAQWLHLAVVYDQVGKTVCHYMNGVLLARETLGYSQPLRLGSAEIGNWNVEGHMTRKPFRNFHGSIDEFHIIARALSSDEIQARSHDGSLATLDH